MGKDGDPNGTRHSTQTFDAEALLPPNSDFCVRRFQEETMMKWTAPRIIEMAVGLEINTYACAELN